MAILLTLIRRELAGYFLSLRGYVIMAGVQMMLGASLLMVVHSLNQRAFNLPLTEVFPQSEYSRTSKWCWPSSWVPIYFISSPFYQC